MTEFSDAKIKHLEILQKIIDRMAGESARMKQFCLVSVAALTSTATATDAGGLASAGIILTVVFWGLDAMYLAQERWFRDMYNVTRITEGPANFVIEPPEEIRAKHTQSHAMLGWSTAFLYVALILINLGIAIAIFASDKCSST